MKVFHAIESYTPSSHGMQEVVKRISEYLATKGHDVIVGTSKHPDRDDDVFINGVRVISFEINGNEARGYRASSREMVRYIEYVKTSSFDVVVLFAAQQWATDLLLSYLADIKSRKIFVPTGFSGLFDDVYSNYYKELAKALPLFDQCIVHSTNYRDVSFIRSIGISKYVTIPNGASANEFGSISKASGGPRQQLRILTIGSHSGFKGHREAVEIVNRAKIRNITLTIIGEKLEIDANLIASRSIRTRLIKFAKRILGYRSNCPDFCTTAEMHFNNKLLWRLKNKKLAIKSVARGDLVEMLKHSDAFLFPSRIECSPIVLYEACAAGTPFIASDVGNAREIAEWTGGGVIVEGKRDPLGYQFIDVKEAARSLEMICRNPSLRDSMGRQGFKAWQESFTWERIVRQYEDLYLKCVSGAVLTER